MLSEIRLIGATTAGLLERVPPDVFDGPVDAACLARFVSDPRHMMVVAVADGIVVGMASGVEYFHPDKPPQLWINEVGVSEACRNRGIGRSLVAALIGFARKRGCTYAWLGTAADNHGAQACFAAVPDGDTPQPFLLYEWDLQSDEDPG